MIEILQMHKLEQEHIWYDIQVMVFRINIMSSAYKMATSISAARMYNKNFTHSIKHNTLALKTNKHNLQRTSTK